MLKNNNRIVITDMAKRSLLHHKGKNIVLILTVMLSVFMLFTILTVGGTWIHMQKQQELHLQGGDYDIFFYGGFTKEQEQIAKNHPQINSVGIAAIAGWAVSTDKDQTLHSTFMWVDDTQWNAILKPARKWVKGEYPQNANEVMATREALEDSGLENLTIGDSFTMTYGDAMGEHTKEFVISGMWDGYGDKKTFYVSREFFSQSGFSLEDYGRGFMYIQAKPTIVTDSFFEKLQKDFKLTKKQYMLLSSTAQASSMYPLLGLAALIAIICLTAWLFIYNIMYLSVSGNIRYYGLLQTIGMTPGQVYRLVRTQMRLIGLIGIGCGLVLAFLTSFGLIPGIVKSLGVEEKNVEIIFHPLLVLLSIILTAVTIKAGSTKPAKLATKASPMEALGYRKVAAKPGRRDKKKMAVVTTSLGISLSVFLCMVTLIDSQAARTIVSNYMESDMVIMNDTMQMKEKKKWKPLIDSAFLQQIQKDKSVSKVHSILNEEIVVPWEEDFMEYWMTSFYDRWEDEGNYQEIKPDYQKHPEKYYSFLVGIDEEEFSYLNSTLKDKVNEKDFLDGKVCILYEYAMGLEPSKVNGKQISYYLSDYPEKKFTMRIEGMANDSYYAGLIGTTPTLIVSNAFIRKITDEAYISKLNIQYGREYDRETEARIKKLMDGSPYAKDFSYDSKIEELESVKKAQGNMMEIGIGLTLLLLFISVMNYINTSVSNLQNNQMKFSIMESIGMTGKQLRFLLIREGLSFAAGSIVFTMTIGLAITYYLYQSMNYRHIPFQIPIPAILAAFCLTTLVCVTVPVIAYGRLQRGQSLVERIRNYD